MSEEQAAPPEVAQTKTFRKDLDEVLQRLKSANNTHSELGPDSVVRKSRERSLAITKIQEAIMWLGMDLKAWREEQPMAEGEAPAANPYPESYNPDSPVVEPTADGLTL